MQEHKVGNQYRHENLGLLVAFNVHQWTTHSHLVHLDSIIITNNRALIASNTQLFFDKRYSRVSTL